MKFSTEIRVRYSETDAMGVVYHSNYLNWMEVGRTEFFRSLDLPYAKIEEEGFFFPVVEAYCKYLKPALYDDLIVVETEILKYTPARVEFYYNIYRKIDGQLLVQGRTIHAFVNRQGRPISIKKVPFIYQTLENITKE